MTLGKRGFDIISVLAVFAVTWPLILWVAFKIWREGDGPIFYVAERMKAPNRPFGLVKFRTMRQPNSDDTGVTGGDKAERISPLGAKLRRRRIDELPQLWNIFKGDMSFVGPRPPLRAYVEAYPDLYARVLKSTPGVTGLATLKYNKRESRLLAQCSSAQETDSVYRRVCIPAKAKLDLIYQCNYRPCLDYWIIWSTLRQIFSKTPS